MAADLATLMMMLLWGASAGGGAEREPRLPQRPAPAPSSPSSGPLPPPPSPPWPQVVPTGLPPFPGSGWEYDEPPPVIVQQRAGQLLSSLWQRGAGTHKTEQIGGRWITFQAAMVASGKKGVVAFRVRQQGAAQPNVRRAPPQLPAPRSMPAATAPSSPPARPPAGVTVLHPKPPVERRPTLRNGAGMGKLVHLQPHVKWVQRVLGLQVIDGKMGPLTVKAVDQFQRSNDCAVDGVVGPETWAALDRHPRARALLQQASA